MYYSVGCKHLLCRPVLRTTLSVVKHKLCHLYVLLSVVNIYSVSCTHYSVGCMYYTVGCKHLLTVGQFYALLCRL